jgi:hypothetical protein
LASRPFDLPQDLAGAVFRGVSREVTAVNPINPELATQILRIDKLASVDGFRSFQVGLIRIRAAKVTIAKKQLSTVSAGVDA